MANDVEAGRAFVRVSIKENLAGLKRVSAKLKSWGASVSGIGMKMAGVGAAISSPFVAAIKAGSDMEETMNKFNVVFGESSKEVKAWSDNFAGSVGRSKKQIADFMAGSQDLFVPLGFAADAATDLSKQITGLAVDLASFNNMSDDDALRDLHAALTGSGEVMKKYGVIVSEAAVKQELLNQKINPKTATEQQKVQARLNIIMRGTTAAQGDAIRSAGGFANQMKALQGRLMDTAVAIGSALLPVVTPFVTQVANAVGVVANWASQNASLVKTIAMVAGGIAAAGVALMGFGGIMTLLGAGIGGVVSLITGMVAVIGAVLSPVGILIAAVVAGAAAFLTMTDTGQQLVAFLQEKFSGLLGFVQGVIGGISDALKSGDLTLAAQIAWAGVLVAWEYVKQALLTSWNTLGNAWDEFCTGLSSAFDSVVTSIQSAWSSVVGWIAQQMLKVWGLIEKALAAVGLLNETTDIGGAIQAVQDDTRRGNMALAQAKQQRDMDRGAALSRRKAARASGASAGLAAAQEELAGLIAQAAAQKAAAEAAAGETGTQEQVQPEQVKAAAAAAAGVLGKTVGTFSAQAAGIAFNRTRDQAGEETAENTRAMRKSLERIERTQGDGGVAFA